MLDACAPIYGDDVMRAACAQHTVVDAQPMLQSTSERKHTPLAERQRGGATYNWYLRMPVLSDTLEVKRAKLAAKAHQSQSVNCDNGRGDE